MTDRYQLKVLDANLTDLVHEIATHVVAQAVCAVPGEIQGIKLYPWVFQECKSVLKNYVRGFHVCGCRPHCDQESQRTELADAAAPAQDLGRVSYRSPRINRYVLMLDIPLKEFAKEFEVGILKAVAQHTPVKNWHGKLFPLIRDAVEKTFGKYLYYSPACNRGEYLCETGTCTAFDPWEQVQPKA